MQNTTKFEMCIVDKETDFNNHPELPDKVASAFGFAKTIVERVEHAELAKTKVILVADDEPLTFELIDEFLKDAKLRFKILRADTGRKAYQLAITEIPDLVITDWIMPEFDGPHLIKKLKANSATAHIPIIVTSGAVFPEEKLKQILESGVTSYFRKPIDEFEMIGCVISALAFPTNWTDSLNRPNM